MSDFGGPSSSQGLPRHEEGEESRQPPRKLLRRTAEGEGTSGEMASSLRPRQPKRTRAKTKQRQRHKNPPPAAATISSPSHSPPISATDLPSLLPLPQPVPPPVHITAGPFVDQLNRSHQTTFTPQSHPSPIVINLCTPSPSPPERDSIAMAANVPAATTSSMHGLDIHSALTWDTIPAMSQSEAAISAVNSSQGHFPPPPSFHQQRDLNAHAIVSVPLGSVRRPPRPTHPYSLRQRSVSRPGSAAMTTSSSGHPYATDLNPSQAGLRLRHYGNPLTALGTLNPMVVPMEGTFHSVLTSSPPSRSSNTDIEHAINPSSAPSPTASSSMQLQTSASSVSAPYCFSLPIRPTHASSAPMPAMNILPPSASSSDPSIAPFSQVPTLASARTVSIGTPIHGSASLTSFPIPQTGPSSSSRINPLHPTLGMNLSSPNLVASAATTRHPSAPSQDEAERMVRNYWSSMAARLDQNTAFIAAHSRGSRNGTGSSDSRQLRPGLGPRGARPATVRVGHGPQVSDTAIMTMSGNIIPVSRWSGEVPVMRVSEPSTVRVFNSTRVPHMSSMSGSNSLADLSLQMVPGASRYPTESDRDTSIFPAYPGVSHLPHATMAPSSSSSSGGSHGLLPIVPTASQDGSESSTRPSGGSSSGLSSRDFPNRAGSLARTFRYRRSGGASTSVASSGPSRRLESEVINVDDIDSDDSDDDVIVGSVEMGDEQRRRQQQISRDLSYARELQAQFDREASVITQPPPSSSLTSHPLSAHAAIPRGNLPSHTVPPTVAPPQPEADHAFPWVPIEEDSFPFDELQLMPPPRGMRRGRGRSSGSHQVPPPHLPTAAEEEGESSIIRDNFEALASRVNSWTAADARRILHVARLATPTGRRRPRTRRNMMGAVMELPPAIIYRAIMLGSPLRDGGSYEELLEIAERLGPARTQGLTKDAINSLPLKDYSNTTAGETESCVVCMSDFEEMDKIRSLPCTHDFHQRCIDYWLNEHKTCPICRVEVRSS